MRIFFTLLFLAFGLLVHSQTYTGQVLDTETKMPLSYVSIGIVGKNVGTVSAKDGRYNLPIGNEYLLDSIKFSSIGYKSFAMQVATFKNKGVTSVSLVPHFVELKEVRIMGKGVKERTIGNNDANKLIRTGFREDKLGYEVGIKLNIDKPTLLKELCYNILECSYDSLFYRVNVYRVIGDFEFENILEKPIYINQKVEHNISTLVFDISQHNIVVDEDVLITLEYMRDMGKGRLLLSNKVNVFGGGKKPFYCRETSQGTWRHTRTNPAIYMRVVQEK